MSNCIEFSCDKCPLQLVDIGDIKNCDKYCDEARVWVHEHDMAERRKGNESDYGKNS